MGGKIVKGWEGKDSKTVSPVLGQGVEFLGGIARWCHLLSDETRLGVLWRLRHGDFNVSELVAYFAIPQSLLSHHLRDLREAGLVASRKEGRFVYYRLTGLGQLLLESLMRLEEEVGGEG